MDPYVPKTYINFGTAEDLNRNEQATADVIAQVNQNQADVELALSGIAMEMWRDTSQSIPNNAVTDIIWEEGASNSALAESYWDQALPTLLTFKRTGMYSVALSVDFAANATGARWIGILKTNYDGVNSGGSVIQAAVGSGEKTQMHMTTHLKVTTIGQAIKAQVRQTSGGALAIPSAFDPTSFAPCIMVARIGDAYDRDTY